MKRYKNFYGSTASIKINRDGTAVLKVSDGHGKRFVNKVYKSERGARIAMGKIGDCWREV